MKSFLRWIAKIIGSTVTLFLVIVLLPYIARIADKLFPDEGPAAIKTSAILARKLETTARLETLKVQEDGVLSHNINAAFIGSVASVDISYRYDASFGIDLTKVTISHTGNIVRLTLPSPEILQDTLTPLEIYEDSFWYKGFSLEDYEALLECERQERRNHYLNGEGYDQLYASTQSAFEETVAHWLREIDASVSVQFEFAHPES